MPTRQRKEKESQRDAEKRKTKAEQDAMFNNPPAHISQCWPVELGNLAPGPEDGNCPDPILRLRGGLLLGDEYGNVFPNSEAIRVGATKANTARKDAAQGKAKVLKKKYPDLWDTRGGAKAISLSEAEHGLAIHEGSVSRYIKEDKKRNP